MDKHILNSDGHPYPEREEAFRDGKLLSEHVGGRYLVVPYQSGYALVTLEPQDEADLLPGTRGGNVEMVTNPMMAGVMNRRPEAAPTFSIDDLPGPEEEFHFDEPNEVIDEEATTPRQKAMEPPLYNADELMEKEPPPLVKEEKKTDVGKKEGLFLSPCLNSFYLEILGVVGLVVLGIWVNITSDFNDPTIKEWMATPGFVDDFNKTILVLILCLIFRYVFIWGMYNYTFEDDIIKARKGIFSRDADSINVRDVRKIGLHQTLIQRLFYFGTLQFYSSGSSGEDVVFDRIKNPVKIRAYIEQYRKNLS